MAQYSALKAAIADVIKTNGSNAITGEIMQQALLSIITSLGADYQFAGLAVPSTDPGTPDQNVFYFAVVAGTYSNFDALVVSEFSVLKYNGTWTKDEILNFDITTQLQTLGLLPSKYSIQSTTWYGDDYTHWVIPVNGGETVQYSGPATFYYALLKSYITPVAGATPDFVDGYSGRQVASTGTFTIPAGTKFLIANQPDLMGYTSIKIDGVECINGPFAAILDIASKFNEQIPTLQNDIEIVRDNNAAAKCHTDRSVAGKAIATSSFPKLTKSKDLRILVQFVDYNAADDATLATPIGTYPLYYRGSRASSTNSWKAGDVLDLRFDNDNNIWYAEPWNGRAMDAELQALKKVSVTDDDLGFTIISKNIANPKKIYGGLVDNVGNVSKHEPAPTDTWRLIEIPVTPGQTITIAGFYLGRTGYYAFYNGDTLVSYGQFSDPAGTTTPLTVTAPANSTILYVDIMTGESPSNPYQYLQANIGNSLEPYDVFKQCVSSINGDELIGEAATTGLDTLIVDLPVSDGTDIASGYAYIDTSTRNVKVKA